MKVEDIKDGMIVTLRRGVERVIIGDYLFCEKGITHKLDDYNSDLTYINNCKSEDIMKIEYGGKVIWERSLEWEKVPFGTKVRAWRNDGDKKQVGRLLHYDENGTRLKFLVFIENIACSKWFECCELLEGGDVVG